MWDVTLCIPVDVHSHFVGTAASIFRVEEYAKEAESILFIVTIVRTSNPRNVVTLSSC
jgi:hypothetical protein